MRRFTIALLITLACAVAGCGGSGGDGGPSSTGADERNGFRGGTVDRLVAAPELGLRTHDGDPVRLADYRGKVVYVSFVYANCPDICPLIVDNLLAVRRQMGADADRVAIVAVSVDPKGDTPARVRAFLKSHSATGVVDYLVGTAPQLRAVWARWGIAARPAVDTPALIEHSGVIWGVDPRGRRATFYPSTGFSAADIASDTRLLLDGQVPTP